MLKAINKYEEIIDFVWDLSWNDLTASYPRRQSYKEIEEMLKKAIQKIRRIF